jgi:hypothetical protein
MIRDLLTAFDPFVTSTVAILCHSALKLYRGEKVTLGPTLQVVASVTEVTFISIISGVQLVADALETRRETFPAWPCFNENGELPRVNRADGGLDALDS